MHRTSSHCRVLVTLVVAQMALAVAVAQAQSSEQCERQFAPRVGQQGKDVIWVPTNDDLAIEMLRAARTTAADYVVDLGAGDGKIAIAAAREFGARALGVEYNPQLVKLAQCKVRAAGLEDKVQIRQADIFDTDFSDATVLTLYLLSDLNMRLRPTILAMKPGTRVVSNTFQMGDWNPDELIEPSDGFSRAYLWIVPAQVQGQWTFSEEGGADRFRASLEQHHQELTFTLPDAPPGSTVRDQRLRGADIEFTLVRRGKAPLELTGQVVQDRIRLAGNRNGRRVRYVGVRE